MKHPADIFMNTHSDLAKLCSHRREEVDRADCSPTTARVVMGVIRERQRQAQLVRDGRIPWNCSNRSVPLTAKLTVLAEEFGEVAKEVCEYSCSVNQDVDPTVQLDRLRTELIQLAAVAVAWAESLDAP